MCVCVCVRARVRLVLWVGAVRTTWGTGQRRRYLLGCLKAFLKSGFERKFYDLGKVGYWGPQSKKKVDFHFDAGRTIAPAQMADWEANADRSRKGKEFMGGVMACGGGSEQLADDDVARAHHIH